MAMKTHAQQVSKSDFRHRLAITNHKCRSYTRQMTVSLGTVECHNRSNLRLEISNCDLKRGTAAERGCCAMLYLFEVPGIREQETLYACWQPLLSGFRAEKAERYRFPKDRFLCAAAFVLLRYALYQEHDWTAMPEIIQQGTEKPVLRNGSSCFNLSHCGSAVLCGTDSGNIGADVQDYSENVSVIRSKFVSARENEAYETVSELTRLWTLKEAFGKYSGAGLCYDLLATDFSRIHSSSAPQRFQKLHLYSEARAQYALSCFAENPIKLKAVASANLLQWQTACGTQLELRNDAQKGEALK